MPLAFELLLVDTLRLTRANWLVFRGRAVDVGTTVGGVVVEVGVVAAVVIASAAIVFDCGVGGVELVDAKSGCGDRLGDGFNDGSPDDGICIGESIISNSSES